MSNYTQYLEFLEQQSLIAKSNSLLYNAIKASNKLMDYVNEDNEKIDENIKKDILVHLDVNEKNEKNILTVLNRIKSVVKGESIKGDKLSKSFYSLSSIVKQRKGSIFPKASIKSQHREKFHRISREIKEILTENNALNLNDSIEQLKNEIIEDLKVRDKKNSNLLLYIILGIIGLILVITFWSVFKWILIIGVILLVIGLFSS